MEGIVIRRAGNVGRAPGRIETADQVPPVEVIVRIELVARLLRPVQAWVEVPLVPLTLG